MNIDQGTIVVGIDGSKPSGRALHWAAEQADAEHRALTLVHAIPVAAPAYPNAGMITIGDAREALEASGHAMLAAARNEAHQHRPGLEIHLVLQYADAAGLLERMSATAAMVVVGSHGRGPIRSKLLGSVSVRLVRHAHCPVVVVRPGKVGAVRNGVVVGLDARLESQPVLEFAYREASLRGLPLTLLHGTSAPASGTLEAVYVPMTPQEREAGLLALAEVVSGMTEKYPDVRVTTDVLDGRPEDLLVRIGERMDLIVVGSHQAHGLERVLFGSVSVAVVERATCPVAVVPVA